jgi:hypothetical protein
VCDYSASFGSTEMLPIFQRLLEEKQAKSLDSRDAANSDYQSCPNILLKCDVVEKL